MKKVYALSISTIFFIGFITFYYLLYFTNASLFAVSIFYDQIKINDDGYYYVYNFEDDNHFYTEDNKYNIKSSSMRADIELIYLENDSTINLTGELISYDDIDNLALDDYPILAQENYDAGVYKLTNGDSFTKDQLDEEGFETTQIDNGEYIYIAGDDIIMKSDSDSLTPLNEISQCQCDVDEITTGEYLVGFDIPAGEYILDDSFRETGYDVFDLENNREYVKKDTIEKTDGDWRTITLKDNQVIDLDGEMALVGAYNE